MIGYAFCGSFCTLGTSLLAMKDLILAGYEVQPIVSENVAHTDTRFWRAEDFIGEVESVCQRKVIDSIVGAEPHGCFLYGYSIHSCCYGESRSCNHSRLPCPRWESRILSVSGSYLDNRGALSYRYPICYYRLPYKFRWR